MPKRLGGILEDGIGYTTMKSFEKAFKRYPSVPTWLAIKQTRQESNFSPTALSPAGAIGLMQLMPSTAKELKVDPWDKEQNIMGGVAYLSMKIKEYNGNYEEAMLAYNGGHDAVKAKRKGRFMVSACTWRESKGYVSAILGIKKYPLSKKEC